MKTAAWLLLLSVLGFLAETTTGQCHNNPCTQTNFREYSNCIQTSCNSNCQCSNVRCNSCQISDQCCQKCCQSTNTNFGCNNCQGSSCPSNCQTSNCQSNCQNSNCQNNCQTSTCQNNCQTSNCQNNCQTSTCQSNCPPTNCQQPTPRPRTCADINCQTCRGDECMRCCDFQTTTEQSGGLNTEPSFIVRPPSPTPCKVINNFRPNISMPNITITINQPPIHITTGPVLNNITVPCPNPGSLTCPTPNNTVIIVPTNSTGCCQVPTRRCVQTSNPAVPHCFNYPQPTCGPQCQAPRPVPFIPPYIPPPPPPPPQYIPQYIPVPQQPIYIPQYIPSPPTQCPSTGCVQPPQPYYPPPRLPCALPGCQTSCIGYGCGQVGGAGGGYPVAGGWYQGAGGGYSGAGGWYPGAGGGYLGAGGGYPQGNCVGQWPYIRCGQAAAGGGYYQQLQGGAVANAGVAYYNPAGYGSQYSVIPTGTIPAVVGGTPTTVLRSGSETGSVNGNDADEDDEEEDDDSN